MKLADRIRTHGREHYVSQAREQGLRRFSIRTGEIVRDLGIGGSRAPAVCSALKTQRFLLENHLRLVEATGPKSGQSTTVTYTYEFISESAPVSAKNDAWERLRGAFKDVFKELGGGEAYLQSERSSFYGNGESE